MGINFRSEITLDVPQIYYLVIEHGVLAEEYDTEPDFYQFES
jgi:hypothetical protein